jgi:large exoprotein involved in heme utilization and adhesion
LTVIAQESIEIIDKSGGPFQSGLFSNSGEGEGGEPTGDAGNIVIKAPQLSVDSGRIVARTLGDGNAGNIIIDVDRLELLGGGQIFNGIGNAQANGEILGNPDGTGRGGLLTVRATEAVVITGEDLAGFSSGLFSNAQIGHGNAGGVVIITPTLDMRDGGAIAATSLNQSTGAAGNISVQVGRLILTEGANISSDTNGVGQGGQVTIVATEDIVITGQSSEGILSGVFTDTTGQGRGGDITLSAPHVQLTDGSAVSAESSGKGDAGNIRIAAQEIALRGGSGITTTVGQGEASGGNILIGGAMTDDGVITDRVKTLTLDGSQITADTDTGSGANITIGVQHLMLDGASAITANTGAGTGGNLRVAGAVSADGTITARADSVVLRGSQLTANAGAGTGGRIDIVTEVFLADPASVIDASSQAGGVDGVVNVEAIVSNLSEIVKPLSSDFAQAAELLRDRCAVQLQEGTVSSLVARGPASVPASPEGIQPSRLYQPSPTSALPQKSERQPGKTDAPQQGMLAVAPLSWPQIINDPFPAHAPVALKCN